MSAESNYRDAFERLKANRPIVLTVGIPVTQNNVAKEAGAVPSALRRERYPQLCDEIQRWSKDNPGASPKSKTSKSGTSSKQNEALKERHERLKKQHDAILSKLIMAERVIVDLTKENNRLKSRQRSEVSPLSTFEG